MRSCTKGGFKMSNKSLYAISHMTFEQMKDRVTVPPFQRRLVWSKKGKEEFVITLSKGYPFGSVLIYKYEKENAAGEREQKYSLIDGLQRYSTIKDFEKNPQNYIEFEDISKKIVESFPLEHASALTITKTTENVNKIVKDIVSQTDPDSYILYEALMAEYKDYVTVLDMKKYIDLQTEIFEIKKNFLITNQIVIPYIEFLGSEDELSVVFENLNRGGKTLTKYQVFSAQWSKYKIILGKEKYNDKILEIVIKRYTDLNDSRDVEIEGFNEHEMRDNREINLSEFCYAFGLLIAQTMDAFWEDRQINEDVANELGYSNLGILLKIRNTKLNEIVNKSKLFTSDTSENFIETLVEKVLSVYSDLNESFKLILRYPSKNGVMKIEAKAATNFQIMSYFAELWNAKYEIDESALKININSKYLNKYKLIIQNTLSQYLFDSATGYWSGTGDKKLDDVSINRFSRLLTGVEKDRLESELINWNEQRSLGASMQFDSLSKSIIVAVMNLQDVYYSSKEYDLEHIIPKNRFKNIYKSQKFAGGTLGNLMILDAKHNRGKSDKTIYESNHDSQTIDPKVKREAFYPDENKLASVMDEIDYNKNDLKVSKELVLNRGKDIITFLVNNLYN